MKSDNLDRLIKESEQALERLERLDSNKNISLRHRISHHFSRNSSYLTSVVLAGSVFVVAYARLNDKYTYQVSINERGGHVLYHIQ